MAIRPPPPPRTESELMDRVLQLAGLSLGELAAQLQTQVPGDPIRAKGWAGQLLEIALGASAASLPEPDFQLLGVELKSIPVNSAGKPLESTYVCHVPLEPSQGSIHWENSIVHLKLARVLWLPIICSESTELGTRKIGRGMLWSPTTKQEAKLREDWEELMDLVCLGNTQHITSHLGTCLQIRPKAANAKARTWGVGEQGERVRTLPRGFYLRSSFTQQLLSEYYAG